MVDAAKIKVERIIQIRTPEGWQTVTYEQIRPGDIFMLFNVNETVGCVIWQATELARLIPLSDSDSYTWQIPCIPVGTIKPNNLFVLGIKPNA